MGPRTVNSVREGHERRTVKKELVEEEEGGEGEGGERGEGGGEEERFLCHSEKVVGCK